MSWNLEANVPLLTIKTVKTQPQLSSVNNMQSAPSANHLVKEPQIATNGFVTKAKAYLLGGIATSTAAIVTNPMDVVKSRLQVQGELHKYDPTKLVYRGQLDAVVKIFKSEGYVNGLQKGLAPAMAYQFCMNGMRLGTYSLLSSTTQNLMPEYNFIRLLLCGAFSGMVGACSASPLFLVKTRMQIQSNTSKIGEQYNYKSSYDALKSIYKNEGIKGMYRGVSAAALRVAVGSSVQLSTYDITKQKLVQELKEHGYDDKSITVHFLAAATSSLFATFAMNPFDVVSTRMYMQRAGNERKYSGILDCITKTLRTEGVRGVYKGALSQYYRLAPHTILTFILFEQLKYYFS